MMSIENLYLKRLADFEFPGEPQPEDPMQMAQAPAQTMTDAQPESGSIREIPRNMFQQALGKFGEALTAAGVQLDKVGLDIPALGRVTLKDLTVGDAGKVLEDMSYGFMPTRGAGGIGGTAGLKPEAAELANLPIVGTAAKAATTVAKAIPGAVPAAAAVLAAQPTEAEGGVGSLAKKIGAQINKVPQGEFIKRDEFAAYMNQPKQLQGFSKAGPSKSFSEQNYKHVEFVEVKLQDGTQFFDAIRGLNRTHAMSRAFGNWPTSSEIRLLPREEVQKADPDLVKEVDNVMGAKERK